MMSSSSQLKFLLALALFCPPSYSQRPAVISTDRSIVITLDPNAPASTIKALAAISSDRVVQVHEGESVATVAKREVGVITPINMEVRQRNRDLVKQLEQNQGSIWTNVSEDTEVHLPDFSLKKEPVKIQIGASTTLKDVAVQVYGVNGPKTKLMLSAVNPTISWNTPLDAGSTIVAPAPPHVQVISLRPGVEPSDVVDKIRTLRGIGTADVNYLGHLEKSVPMKISRLQSDSTQSLASDNDTWYINALRACEVDDHDTDASSDVLIGVLDSGIISKHSSFQSDLWKNADPDLSDDSAYVTSRGIGYDFVHYSDTPEDDTDDSHGTHVAGLVSARILGEKCKAFRSEKLDQHIKLLILKIAESDGTVSLGAVSDAIYFAAEHGVRVIVGSWNLVGSPTVREAIARYQSILFVTAAGNGVEQIIDGQSTFVGQKLDQDHTVFPASYKLRNQLTVAGSDEKGDVAAFSNFGPDVVHIIAPSVNIRSTIRPSNDGTASYGPLSGTSQATPLAALAAAVLLAHNGKLDIATVKTRILNTADWRPDWRSKVASGMLDLPKALAIDTDLLEVKSDTSSPTPLLRGAITNSEIHFAAFPKPCAEAKTYDVAEDRLMRIVYQKESDNYTLIAGGKPFVGVLCDDHITFESNHQGQDIPANKIQDLIWHFPQ